MKSGCVKSISESRSGRKTRRPALPTRALLYGRGPAHASGALGLANLVGSGGWINSQPARERAYAFPFFFFLPHCAEKPAGGCSRSGNLGAVLAPGSVLAVGCVCNVANVASSAVTRLACSCLGSGISSRQKKFTIPTWAVLVALALAFSPSPSKALLL